MWKGWGTKYIFLQAQGTAAAEKATVKQQIHGHHRLPSLIRSQPWRARGCPVLLFPPPLTPPHPPAARLGGH